MNITRRHFAISSLTLMASVLALLLYTYTTYTSAFKRSVDTFFYIFEDIFFSASEHDLMLGSSSILRMNAERSLTCGHWLNRGLAASNVDNIINYITYSPATLNPTRILIYAGENDIANGLSSRHTLKQYKYLLNLLLNQYTRAQIHILAIKPSPKRTAYFTQFNEVNHDIRLFSKKKTRLHFHSADWISDSHPYFLNDKVHLTEHGYTVFTKGFNQTCKM